MGYRYMTIETLQEMFRRWHAKHSITSITNELRCDRNTIRTYIRLFKVADYTPGCKLPPEQELLSKLQDMLPLRARSRSIRQCFEAHKEEVIALISRDKEPVKPKTAFLIIKEKYNLNGSYETFKLFMREHMSEIKSPQAPLRIELPPGEETQLDYGKVGFFYDPKEKCNKTVWAFCAKLSCSRLPFIEYVYTQSQDSFTQSAINMAEFYGGLTGYVSIDNLKAGVIKPDLYDPLLNRAFAEFAAYYGTFINTCRVATPTDKGKIERSVPQARELFRRLKEVHPTFNLAELNEAAKRWCLEEYGMKNHGTTSLKPKVVFDEVEKQTLISLPDNRFEVPVWKPVVVGGDRYITFEKKYYAMPVQYRFKTLNARKASKILRVFDSKYTLIREYIITGKKWSSLPGDFPEDKEAMMKGEYPTWILSKAHELGPAAVRLIEAVLKPNAYINSRRARGILSVLEKYSAHPFREDICNEALKKRIFIPKQIADMLEQEKRQMHFDFVIPVSDSGKAMLRDISEYFN